jgi:hypothetical protein
MQQDRFPFSWGMPREHLARRKMKRKISTIVIVILSSLLVAGLVLYFTDPNLSFLR